MVREKSMAGRAFQAKEPATVGSWGIERGWHKGRLKHSCERPRKPPE